MKTGRIDCLCGDQIISNSGKTIDKSVGIIACWNPKCGQVYNHDTLEKLRIENEIVIFEPPGKDLKVFKMNDCDWWMDYNLIDAIINYSEFIMIPSEESTDDPYQLSKKSLNTLEFYPDDDSVNKYSFLEELQRRQSISAEPGFFASTEY